LKIDHGTLSIEHFSDGITFAQSLPMPGKPWYQEWFSSPFYHKLYLDRNEAEASAFIQKMVTHLSPAPGSRMLDVACGKGRHSRILASMGYPVTGIDLSSESIAAAKQYETDSLDFFVHDMRLPFWGNYFNFAFNLFTSFGYFKTRREHDDAIRTIAKSLRPGGLLVIDYLNVHHTEEHLQYNETRQINGTTYDIHRWDDETHFYKKITIIDPSILEPLSFIEQVAKFTLGDFTDMLSFQGLQVQEVFGDYQFSPYDIRKTPRLIIVASKGTPEKGDKEKRIYSDGRTTDPLT
jgi:SAM-dependent methyltransferase